MSYFNETEISEFYADRAEEYPFSKGGECFTYTEIKTDQCAHICIAPIDMFDAVKLAETKEYVLAGETTLVPYPAGSSLHYGIDYDHGSDSGPEGWNLFADIYIEEGTQQRWAQVVSLISVAVPLPSTSFPEYEDFPGDETRTEALLYAIDWVLDRLE